MSFYELAKSRWSVRSYKDTPIEEEKMQLILEAGRVAPTAKNFQPQRIYIAKSEESRKKLASVCRPGHYGCVLRPHPGLSQQADARL